MSEKTKNAKTEKKWRELKKFLEKQRKSPLSVAEDVREKAAQLYEDFLNTLPLRQRQLYFVTLKLDVSYPSAIRREEIPDMIRKSPEFYRDWAEATGD